MSGTKRVQIGVVVVVALLLTLVAGIATAHAATATSTLLVQPKQAPTATAGAPATAAAPATSGETSKETSVEGAAAGSESEPNQDNVAPVADVTHKPGQLTEQQLKDVDAAFTATPGYNLLIVAVLGLFVTAGVIGFAAFEQMKP